MDADKDIKPDMILLVADASNLKHNLLFCSQIIDLKVPVVALDRHDGPRSEKGIEIDVSGLEREWCSNTGKPEKNKECLS